MKTLSTLALVSLVFLSSCISGIPISTAPAKNNDTFAIEYLFEHEGCKVYRFSDYGNHVYFTNCNGDVTAIKNDSTKTRIVNHVKILDNTIQED